MPATKLIESLTEEDSLRAQLYGLLGRLLGVAPDGELLQQLASLQSDSTPLGHAFGELAKAARTIDAETAEDEYNALFVGVTQGELVPYASHYITGFLNDKPLLKVRESLEELGILRSDGVSEPEDHMAFLCEVSSGLIAGTFGVDACINIQKAFFSNHLAPWAGKFFADLETAPSAILYRPVGELGRIFMEVEKEAFKMSSQ